MKNNRFNNVKMLKDNRVRFTQSHTDQGSKDIQDMCEAIQAMVYIENEHYIDDYPVESPSRLDS